MEGGLRKYEVLILGEKLVLLLVGMHFVEEEARSIEISLGMGSVELDCVGFFVFSLLFFFACFGVALALALALALA